MLWYAVATRRLISERCSLSSLALCILTLSLGPQEAGSCACSCPWPHGRFWSSRAVVAKDKVGLVRMALCSCHVGLGRSHGKQQGQLTCLCPDKG